MNAKKEGEFRSRVYEERPEYADYDSERKFEAIQGIIMTRLLQHPNAICSYSGGSDSGRGGFLSALPPVTKNLIIINVIIFLASLLNENFMIGTFALFYPTSPYFHWWQVVTHMFMHGGFWHIFFNIP